MKIERQKEHLIGAQSQVSEEIFNQKAQMDELTERGTVLFSILKFIVAE